MAKKRRKKSQANPGQLTKAKDLVQLAEQQIRRGRSDWAVGSAERSLKFAKSQEETAAAHVILARGHLNLALDTDDLAQRLHHLEESRRFGGESALLSYHRGVTLWRLHKVAEALAAFERAVASRAGAASDKAGPMPELDFLHQLARVAAGQSWEADQLSTPQANTLRLIQALLAGRSKKERQGLLDQPLVGDPAIWQTLVAVRDDPAALDLEAFARLTDNMGKNPLLSAVLHYLRGVAAMQTDHPDVAKAAWSTAQRLGWDSPTANQNWNYRLRNELIDLADAGQWQEIVAHAQRYTAPDDTIWAETVGLARFHLGWEAAQAEEWQTAAMHWRAGNEIWGNRHLAQNLALAEESLNNWMGAAEAWREMIRRRPRKENHPDYLSDDQVAALWAHAADCYERAGVEPEVITCLQNAVKYAPEDVDLRLRLVSAYVDDERLEAAENELGRILEIDENNLAALTHLGALYRENPYYRDAASVWRRILAIDPNHADARDGLATDYVQKADRVRFLKGSAATIKFLEQGLAEVPNSPYLLITLALIYRDDEQDEQARHYFLETYRAAPQVARLAGVVTHELLHLEADADVEAMLPEMREMRGLQPAFWVEQGRRVLECELGHEWAMRFFEEAIDLSEKPEIDDTRAGVLIDIYEAAFEEDEDDLAAQYRKRVQEEVPESGAVEYLDGHNRNFERGDSKGARRLMDKAKRQAKRANDPGVLRRAEAIENLLSGSGLPNLFGRGMPDPKVLERMMEQFFGEDDDEFPDFF